MRELKIKMTFTDGRDRRYHIYETQDASTYGNGKYIGIYKDNKEEDLIDIVDCRYIKHYNFIAITIEYLLGINKQKELESILIINEEAEEQQWIKDFYKRRSET